MGFNEKRSAERISYQGKPHGALYLRLPERRLDVQRILDISNSGIRVALDSAVAVSSKVALEYIDGPIKIEVFGMIARISDMADEVRIDSAIPNKGYLVGIALMSPMTLIAMIQAGNDYTASHP